MKKIYVLIYFSFFILLSSYGQAGTWTWLSGDSVANSAAAYGTKGVASVNNHPPALYESCEWADLSGDLWLFGGLDFNGLFYADLWKYHPATNEWTWMKGPGTTGYAGSFGTIGVASPLNNPPYCTYGGRSWVDLQGNLWLYGGIDWSAIWKYDITTNNWTWMQGSKLPSQPAVFGTKGVPNAANTPGSRFETAAAWTDNAGNLWCFGGGGSIGIMNDLWRYNIATGMWTWMKGSNAWGQNGVYGSSGVEDSANTPGARYAYTHWKDNAGNLWLFGGWDGFTDYNDLWRYNSLTNNWAWMGGSDTANARSSYGSQCIASASNVPGGRGESRAVWTDQDGNFWLFGGAFNSTFDSTWNDLWKYCVAKNQWMWVSGDSIPNLAGRWGTKGIANPLSKPNGRGGAIGWADHNGHLYLFGGGTTNYPKNYNDLWKYTIDTVCSACNVVLPVAGFQSSDSSLCENDCITFTNLSINATSYQWTFTGGIPSSSTDQNPQACYLTSGIYNVTLVASNSGASDTLSSNNFITVNTSPPTPTIQEFHGIGNDTLICSTDTSYKSYQWYDNTTLIVGATDTILVVTKNGNYNLRVTNSIGCKTAVGINVILGLQNYMTEHVISLWPNPVGNNLQLAIANWQNRNSQMQINIYNVLGQVCQQSEIKNPKSEIITDVSSLPPGIYFVLLTGNKERWVGRFVKE